MKRLFKIVLLIVCVLLFSSCSNDYKICDSSYSNIIIKGHISWTDYGNTTRDARYAKVKVWNDELLHYRLVGMAVTDENGNYEMSIKNSPDYGVYGRGLYIEFYPETVHATIVRNGDDFYTRRTITRDDLDGNVAEFNEEFGTDYRGKAFSIVQAVEYGAEYVYRMEGAYLPQVSINYPSNSGSYYDTAKHIINVSQVNFYDWDVVLHEYGHYVEDMFDFSSGAGGDHYINEDLTDRFSMDIGVRKAWNEGWATYFSLSCQKYLAMNELSMLNLDYRNTFSDDYYDVKKLKDMRIDVNVKTMWRYGAGCETSVAGFLLSVADLDISPLEQFSYGYKAIWDIVVENKIICMADFCRRLYDTYPNDISRIKELEAYFSSGM